MNDNTEQPGCCPSKKPKAAAQNNTSAAKLKQESEKL
jgi:hypothetical protein